MVKRAHLERTDLTRERRLADNLLYQLELGRDLTQSIVHVDCDAFYASVEQLDRPELVHLPFAVGGGVLTTCNYVARQYGVRSGMAGFVARRLCPQLVMLPLNFGKYNAKAKEIREILAEYDPRFESASIDEAYLNITEYCRLNQVSRTDAVEKMRKEVHDKTKITLSAGIAANGRLAKICSNRNKPNGQFELPNERPVIMDFMRELACRQVNGIGRVFERELAAVGVKSCGDIFTQRQFLRKLFGEKACEFLMEVYLGLGRTCIQPADEYERKSVGTESTFKDMDDPIRLREKLKQTAEELEKDMKRAGCKGRTLCLKVKLHTFEVLTRQISTPRTVQLAEDLYKFALPILAKLEQEIPNMKIRLMGLRCTHLISTKKPDTMAFFGLKKHTIAIEGAATEHTGSRYDCTNTVSSDDGWEIRPEEELYSTDAAIPPVLDGAFSPTSDQSSSVRHRSHGHEVVLNPKKEKTPEAKTSFECPICRRPQSINERQVNDHIDICLSRQVIRDTVQATQSQSPPYSIPAPKPLKTGTEKKRGRPPGAAQTDPRQKKLCFG